MEEVVGLEVNIFGSSVGYSIFTYSVVNLRLINCDLLSQEPVVPLHPQSLQLLPEVSLEVHLSPAGPPRAHLLQRLTMVIQLDF